MGVGRTAAGTRAGVLAVAAAFALVVAGCDAGQDAETARETPDAPGVYASARAVQVLEAFRERAVRCPPAATSCCVRI